jgi:hypothetical protein
MRRASYAMRVGEKLGVWQRFRLELRSKAADPEAYVLVLQ